MKCDKRLNKNGEQVAVGGGRQVRAVLPQAGGGPRGHGGGQFATLAGAQGNPQENEDTHKQDFPERNIVS